MKGRERWAHVSCYEGDRGGHMCHVMRVTEGWAHVSCYEGDRGGHMCHVMRVTEVGTCVML